MQQSSQENISIAKQMGKIISEISALNSSIIKDGDEFETEDKKSKNLLSEELSRITKTEEHCQSAINTIIGYKTNLKVEIYKFTINYTNRVKALYGEEKQRETNKQSCFVELWQEAKEAWLVSKKKDKERIATYYQFCNGFREAKKHRQKCEDEFSNIKEKFDRQLSWYAKHTSVINTGYGMTRDFRLVLNELSFIDSINMFFYKILQNISLVKEVEIAADNLCAALRDKDIERNKCSQRYKDYKEEETVCNYNYNIIKGKLISYQEQNNIPSDVEPDSYDKYFNVNIDNSVLEIPFSVPNAIKAGVKIDSEDYSSLVRSAHDAYEVMSDIFKLRYEPENQPQNILDKSNIEKVNEALCRDNHIFPDCEMCHNELLKNGFDGLKVIMQNVIDMRDVDLNDEIKFHQMKIDAIPSLKHEANNKYKSTYDSIAKKMEIARENFENTENNLFQKISELRLQDALLSPIWAKHEIIQEKKSKTVNDIIDNIKKIALSRYTIDYLPENFSERIDLDNLRELKSLEVVNTFEWHKSKGDSYNLVINYSKEQGELESAIETLNNLLMNIILMLPIKDVNFTLYDPSYTSLSFITNNLHESLYQKESIVNEDELRNRVDVLQGLLKQSSKTCTNVLDYNRKNKTILNPYEVVVMSDVPLMKDSKLKTQLDSLITNGYKGGIFFIILNNTDKDSTNSKFLSKFIEVKLFNCENNREYYFNYVPITTMSEEYFAYINKAATERRKMKPIVQNISNICVAPYKHAATNYSVEVGAITSSTVDFFFDYESNVHAFVLGGTGSGKSVFLHNIILNSILKYSPDSLEFHLLDLKEGGVEFNRYRDVKHVKTLLADNSDRQVTLEILKDINLKMKHRGSLFRQYNIQKLEDYNNQFSDAKLPIMIVVIDECHKLFIDAHDKIQAEISSIITNIAKEGRSQGVHLLFATQTLSNTNIPTGIINGFTNFYLLLCKPMDSDKLVPNSSKITSKLSTGQVYYSDNSTSMTFQAYYADEVLKESIEISKEKSSNYDSNQFYFNGSQLFTLDTERVSTLLENTKRSPMAYLGKSIDLKLIDVSLKMNSDLANNILIFGSNLSGQTTHTSLSMFITLILSYQRLKQECDFYIIDCIDNEDDTKSYDTISSLKDYGVNICSNSMSRGKLLADLGDKVRSNTENERDTVVLIIGQERFREVRNNDELPIATLVGATSQDSLPQERGFLGGDLLKSRERNEKRTYRSELQFLLERGSEQGIHFILQVDKPTGILNDSSLSQNIIYKMFKHIVMLKSSTDVIHKLRLPDNIKLDTLSDDEHRLRAYYYNDESQSCTLTTPFALPSLEQLDKIFQTNNK